MNASKSAMAEEDGLMDFAASRSKKRHGIAGSPDSEPEISEDSAQEVQASDPV